MVKGAAWVLSTDRLWPTSPDAGHPKCVCSRCGELITDQDAERSAPIRVFMMRPKKLLGRGKPEEVIVGEYRYHSRCLGLQEGEEAP